MSRKIKRKNQNAFLRFFKSKELGIVLAVIEIVLAAVLMVKAYILNMVPTKYIIPATVIIVLLSAYLLVCAFTRKFRTFGKILSILISVIMVMGIYYISYASGTISKVGGAKFKTDIVNVYVLNEDGANDINDAKDYSFGIVKDEDSNNTNDTISAINEVVGKTIDTKEYDSVKDLILGLYSGDVGAVVFNQAYESMTEDMDEVSDFSTRARVLYNKTFETKIEVDNSHNVTQDAFIMYVSGIDTEGPVSTTSRSDVNIIAVVNPSTNQIVMINTPRDFYVPMARNGEMDKLTHAGESGIDESMNTLNNLYGININYYFRLNFTGFKSIVDSLGGIEINNEFDGFECWTNRSVYINHGINYLDGTSALAYVRERHAFGSGDRQRGKNQMSVINAVVSKMASPTMLSNFSSIMDSMANSFQTSLSSEQISDLVRNQLDEGGTWNIKQYSVTGEGANEYCYALKSANYVMIPDYSTVDKAKSLINRVMNGETLTDADVQ